MSFPPKPALPGIYDFDKRHHPPRSSLSSSAPGRVHYNLRLPGGISVRGLVLWASARGRRPGRTAATHVPVSNVLEPDTSVARLCFLEHVELFLACRGSFVHLLSLPRIALLSFITWQIATCLSRPGSNTPHQPALSPLVRTDLCLSCVQIAIISTFNALLLFIFLIANSRRQGPCLIHLDIASTVPGRQKTPIPFWSAFLK